MIAGTLHTVTRILRVLIYSGCSRKNLVLILLAAILATCPFVGIGTSHVAKVLRQKYWQGTPDVRRRLSKHSLFKPTNFLVFRSVTTREKIRGSTFGTISGMGKISFPTKNSAYLPTLSFSQSSGSLCWIFQGLAGVVGVTLGLLTFCPGGIGLEDSGGEGKDGQLDPTGLLIGQFWGLGLSRSSGCLKRDLLLFEPSSAGVEDVDGDTPSMIADCNQEGRWASAL